LIREEIADGTEIFARCIEVCEEGDAQAQKWNAQERPERQEGNEPQAGDRHRAFGSASGRQEGPAQGCKESQRKESWRKEKFWQEECAQDAVAQENIVAEEICASISARR
jgi:hypothetical protein